MDSDGVTRRTVVGGDGLELVVYERNVGASETVLAVHGYPDDHAVWDPVADRLAERFHVVTYDVRGAGHSAVPDDVDGYRLSLLAEDVAAVLGATVTDGRPVHLVGHDWGSIQGWHFVCDVELGDRFGSYTSISGPHFDAVGSFFRRETGDGRQAPSLPTLALQTAKSWYVGVFQLPWLAPAFWRSGFSRRAWPKVLERSEGVPVELLPDDDAVERVQSNGANGVNLYRANVLRAMTSPEAVSTSVPVQIVVPRGDRYVSPALATCTTWIPDDVVVTPVDGGHWLPLTDPDMVASLVTEHIDRCT